MDISLPYSRRKRYLTGIDWVVNAFDHITRRRTGHGNESQVILVLGGEPDVGALKELLRRILRGNPVLGGRVSRDWTLCPHWAMGPPPADDAPLSVERLPDAPADVLEAFRRHLHRPFPTRRDHLHFHLVRCGGGRSYLGMRFDHRLLDAYGAEMFMELLQRVHTGTADEVLSRVELTEPAHLDRWARRFAGGRGINRLLMRLTREGVATFPAPRGGPPHPTRFNVVSFSPAQTSAVLTSAQEESGYLMVLPALLARVVGGLHRLARRRGRAQDNYVVPVSLVRRTLADRWEKLFFNHLSFIMLRAPVGLAGDRAALTDHLRMALYEQMAAGVADDFYHATMLARIAPLGLLRLFSRLPMGGSFGTCYFACLRESGYRAERFMGLEVENLIHTPHVPPPPGLGVFLNVFGERLNLVLSHLEGTFTPAEAEELARDMRERFLD